MRARTELVVTTHHGKVEVLEEFRERAEGGGQVGALDSPSFVAAVVEWVVTSHFRAFEAVDSELEELDAKVMSDIPKTVSEDTGRTLVPRRLHDGGLHDLLRQRGSPESKRVGAPRDATATSG